MRFLRWGILSVSILVVVAIGAAALGLARGYSTPFPGFLVYRSGAVTSLWRAGWPGRQAGLKVRDVVIAVDGEPVQGGAAFARALERRWSQERITVQVQEPRSRMLPGGLGAVRSVELPLAGMRSWDRVYALWLPFSIGVIYLLLGTLLFAFKPSRESALATALCFVAAAFYLAMYDAHTTWHLTRVWLLYPLLGPLSVHLFAVFPEVRPRVARRRVLVPLYLGSLAVILWRQLAVDDPVGSDLPSLVSSIVLSCEFTIDLALLGYTMLRGSTPMVRNRAKSIFIGLGLTCGASVVWQFASRIGPPYVSMSADEAMVLSALFPVLIAYGMLKRNLFDMDAVLRASLSWGLSTLFVLGVYFALAALAGNVAARLYGTTTAAVAATLVAALLFHPVRLRAQRLVDRLWMRERDAGPELLDLLRRLPGTEGTAALAEVALGPLRRISGARGVLLYTRAGQSYELVGRDGEVGPVVAATVSIGAEGALARALASRPQPQAVRDLGDEAAAERLPDGIELLLPLCSRGALVGIVALTARKRGLYGWAILRALENAAPQLALALENAKLVADGVMRDRLAALGQLAAVIVHEVKNPLGIIKVSAGGLRKRARDRDDDAAAELASCIEDEADRMDLTVRRLLELARPPAPQLSPCDVGQVIRHTLDRLRPDLAAAGILVDTALDEAPRVTADAEELRRALFNLFLNAREAMPTGGRLSVRLRGEEGGVEIDVEDTGHGMDEATRRQLFRPFFTTRHGGTGLGLALVKRVVEDHKGAIRVDSRPGEGSRFTLTLPV